MMSVALIYYEYLIQGLVVVAHPTVELTGTCLSQRPSNTCYHTISISQLVNHTSQDSITR